jgi:hypothetical protein
MPFMQPDKHAVTVSKRGIVEFNVPSGSGVSVIGLRAKADRTLMTTPVLTK